MERPNFNCIKYDTQTEIEDIRLYLKDLNDYCTYLENQNEQLRIGGVRKSLPTKDAEFIYSLLPDWVKNKAPEGLDPIMYGTLSKEGDDEIQERVRQILGNVC